MMFRVRLSLMVLGLATLLFVGCGGSSGPTAPDVASGTVGVGPGPKSESTPRDNRSGRESRAVEDL